MLPPPWSVAGLARQPAVFFWQELHRQQGLPLLAFSLQTQRDAPGPATNVLLTIADHGEQASDLPQSGILLGEDFLADALDHDARVRSYSH